MLRNVKLYVLSYKVFFWREMQSKHIMVSNSKIIVWIIVISTLTKNNRAYDFFHNQAALASLSVSFHVVIFKLYPSIVEAIMDHGPLVCVSVAYLCVRM